MAQKQSARETTADDSDKDQRISPVSETGEVSDAGAASQTEPPKLPQYCYTKEQLVEISNNCLSKERPACLDRAYDNSCGLWDPERWFLGKRRSESPLSDDPKLKRERPPDLERELAYKRRPSDPKEWIKEEQDNIVLSPQRRSFGTGCHVTQQPVAGRRPESPADSRGNDRDSYRDPGRRIGSGRIISRDRDGRGREREFTFRGSDRRDRDRFERGEERDVRFTSRSNSYGERKGGRGRQHRIEEEEEPEWFSGGPTSQSETIELHGFEDIPEEDHEDSRMDMDKEESSEPKGKRRRRSGNWRKNKGVLMEENGIPEEDEKEGDEDTSKENYKNANSGSVGHASTENGEPSGSKKQASSNEFDVNKIFEADTIPGIFQNGTPSESWNGPTGSRFSQFFRVESPSMGGGSGSDSRRSSLQEELGNLLNGGNSDNYFTPITSQQQQNSNSSKHIMDLLQNANSENYSSNDGGFKNSNLQELALSGQACNVQELEAGLKQLVLGTRCNSESGSVSNGQTLSEPNRTEDEMPAFTKLLAQISEGHGHITEEGMGPVNRNGVSQDEERHQMGKAQIPSQKIPDNLTGSRQSPVHFNNNGGANLMNILKNAPTEQDILAGHVKGQPVNHQPNLPNQSATCPDFLTRLFQQLQHPTRDTNPLSKLLGSSSSAPMRPISPQELMAPQAKRPLVDRGLMTNGQLNRPPIVSADVSSKMSQQQQREILASIVKVQQQQQHQLHQAAAAVTSGQLQPTIVQQPASPPTLLRPLSPRPQSPPQVVFQQQQQQQQQARIPSPLVFGQTPPLLPHAPSPIHPTQMMANIGPILPMHSNTLQVFNPPLIQRGPSPQELVYHTQKIMQNALIKTKLEEQKEKFRKRQEMERSPNVSGKLSGSEVSPSKVSGMSSTMATFTPTSVMRKMQAEKEKDSGGKGDGPQQSTVFKPFGVNASNDKVNVTAQAKHDIGSNLLDLDKVPRPLHGQGLMHSQVPPHRGPVGPNSGPHHGRPIVKGNQGIDQSVLSKVVQQPNISGSQNKNFLGNNQTNYDLNKLLEQQRLMQNAPRQLSTASPMPPHAGYPVRGATGIHPSMTRSGLGVAPPNVLLRNVVHSSVNTAALRAQLNQLALMQQCSLEPQQQLPGPRYIHPALHHLLRGQTMARSQPPSNLNLHGPGVAASKPDTQSFGTFTASSLPTNNNNSTSGNLLTAPGTVAATVIGAHGNRQSSPINSNLAKWFGNDILQQKLTELPPVPTQKALSLEELERHQQQKTAV